MQAVSNQVFRSAKFLASLSSADLFASSGGSKACLIEPHEVAALTVFRNLDTDYVDDQT